MYLPDLSGKVDARSIITTSIPLETSRFTLSISGVLGLFGGDAAISAMAMVHVHKGQRWLGWYNTPGSYQIAKKYGLASTSSILKAIFPGAHTDAAKVFEFDGWRGPKFQAIYSGTILDSTGHLASVLMKECASLTTEKHPGPSGWQGPPTDITIVKLDYKPAEEVDLQRLSAFSPFFAIIPITVSIAGCITSGVFSDWFAFSSILLGMLNNGILCLVIGSGTIHFTHHTPAPGSPLGDGILGSGRQFALLRGTEGAINSVTGGEFSFRFPFGDGSIGYCAILFIIQFIAQLFLIPQASLLGQIMFVSSFAASWVYNLALSAYGKEKIQSRILLDQVLRQKIPLKKHTFSRRTTAAVFALCVLLHDERAGMENGAAAPHGQDDVPPHSTGGPTPPANPSPPPRNPHLLPRSQSPLDHNHHREVASTILRAYLPNDTRVWRKWKEVLLERLCTTGVLHFEQGDWDVEEYAEEERRLLETLCNYAQDAYDVYESSVSHPPN